jgi:hypothetical protein
MNLAAYWTLGGDNDEALHSSYGHVFNEAVAKTLPGNSFHPSVNQKVDTLYGLHYYALKQISCLGIDNKEDCQWQFGSFPS